MHNYTQNVKEVFQIHDVNVEKDKGDLVQSILITTGFAISTIVIMTWLSVAIVNKGADRANCIEQANTFTQEGVEVCSWEETVVDDDTTFKNDDNYKDRFATTS